MFCVFPHYSCCSFSEHLWFYVSALLLSSRLVSSAAYIQEQRAYVQGKVQAGQMPNGAQIAVRTCEQQQFELSSEHSDGGSILRIIWMDEVFAQTVLLHCCSYVYNIAATVSAMILSGCTTVGFLRQDGYAAWRGAADTTPRDCQVRP